MHIIAINGVDKSGRVNVNGLFGAKKVETVVLAVDVETEMIEVIPIDEELTELSSGTPLPFGIPQKIDDKNRLVLPMWLRDELAGCKNLCLIVDGDRRFLSPRTGSIIAGGK